MSRFEDIERARLARGGRDTTTAVAATPRPHASRTPQTAALAIQRYARQSKEPIAWAWGGTFVKRSHNRKAYGRRQELGSEARTEIAMKGVANRRK